jgi:2-methylcitrate dehydratase
MTEPQIANAIAMAAASDASFAVIRAKPLSQWKGLASSQSALSAMNALYLARRGVEGPLQVVEGPNGIDNLLHMRLDIDWDHEGYDAVPESTIKKYNAMIHTQSAVYCMIELVTANQPRFDVKAGFDPNTIAVIEAEVPQLTYDFAGGGLYGSLGEVRTKEEADHDLRYLLAVALLDDEVMPAQFAADRITRSDVQSLLTKVSARPNASFTAQYPASMPAKITVRLKDGTTLDHEVQDFPGMPSRPFTWDEEVAKFDQLVSDRIDSDVATQIKEVVRSLEDVQVSDLTTLLAGAHAP